MKVLHVFKTYLPETFTGTERVIHGIAQSTLPYGVQSTVLTLSATPRPGPIPVDGHVVYQGRRHLDIASTGISFSALGLYRRLAAETDVINYHFPWPMMDVLHILGRPRVPSVATYHSDIVRQKRLGMLYSPLMHAFLGQVDRIVATSPNYLASSPVLQRYKEKVAVIPIGIEPERPGVSPDLLESWRGRVGDGFALYVGAPRYYKGLPYLLAASRLSGLPVVIAGADAAEIRDLTAADAGRVKVVGRIDDSDKEALLTLCGTFVLPSHLRSEAYGVVLVEAARAGKPLISCALSTGTSFVNRDGETGIVVPPGDAVALAGAMTQLARDRELAARLGAGAARHFSEQLGAEAMGRAYAALYAGLTDARV